MIFGSHMSTEGGLHTAFDRAQAAGCDAVQIFTRNRAMWAARPLGDEQVRTFRSSFKESGIHHVVAHASYLLNIASPDRALRERSAEGLILELERCEALGIPFLVIHPGSHGGDGERAGIRRAVASINGVHTATRGFEVRILVETSSGQGRSICSAFESLGALLRDVKDPRRLGACVDTCHIFAAGYELRSRSGYAATLEALESAIGLDRIFCVHANDSKGELGCRVDRHEHIGRGRIGRDGFRNLVNDRRFEGIPLIIELPPEGDMPRVNLRALRSLVRQTSRGSPAARRSRRLERFRR